MWTRSAFVDQGFVRNADDLSFSNASAHALNVKLTAGTMMYNERCVIKYRVRDLLWKIMTPSDSQYNADLRNKLSVSNTSQH